MDDVTTRPTRRARALGLAVLALAAPVVLVACGEEPETPDATPDTFVVGVRDDSPGLSQLGEDGTYTGLDVDLGRYLAAGLGAKPDDVELVTVSGSQTQRALRDGEVDLVMSVVLDPKGRAPDGLPPSIELAGPYLESGQDLLVPTRSTVTSVRSLGTRKVCAVAGSDDLRRLREPDRAPDITWSQVPDLTSCFRALAAGQVDAVTGDDVALAGYSASVPGGTRVVGVPLTEEPYTVGLPPDSDDVSAVDALLQRAIDDGTWERLVEEHLVSPGYRVPPPPAPGTA